MWRRNNPSTHFKRGALFSLNATLFALFFLAGCSPQSFFYYPNRNLYQEPEKRGIHYQILEYPSLNGKILSAILMQTEQRPKATVVHFHGNYGNLSNHFPLSAFLLKHGYDVLIFDYQGYGGSDGHPNPRNCVEDGIATIRYAQAHPREPNTGVIVFGQSLGAAVGIVAMAKEPEVKAAVFEGSFTSYKQMGKEALQRSAWTWLFSFLTPVLVGSTYDPIRYVADIAPRPIYFIHGDKDHTVPVHMSKDLYDKAKEPKKLWIAEGMGHLAWAGAEKKKYEEEVAGFFDAALTNRQKN